MVLSAKQTVITANIYGSNCAIVRQISSTEIENIRHLQYVEAWYPFVYFRRKRKLAINAMLCTTPKKRKPIVRRKIHVKIEIILFSML